MQAKGFRSPSYVSFTGKRCCSWHLPIPQFQPTSTAEFLTVLLHFMTSIPETHASICCPKGHDTFLTLWKWRGFQTHITKSKIWPGGKPPNTFTFLLVSITLRVFISFPTALMKYPDKSHLRETRFIWLTMPVYNPSLCGSQGDNNLEKLLTSHPRSRSKANGLMHVCPCSSHSHIFISPGHSP